jgi:transcriptional regulator with XRE-family HTH domain
MKSLSNANGHKGVLADRIRMARRSAKLSQSELAETLNVASSAVAQWENPRGTSPRIEKFSALADAIGVSVEWLLTGSGERRRHRHADEHQHHQQHAITPDSFARDTHEELLLKQFRRLPARKRDVFMGLLVELASAR